MRIAIALILICLSSYCYGQLDDRISTIDFVQIIDNNKAEAHYYFENNWKVLRDQAIVKGYIESYQVLETPVEEGQPFELMFITTYLNVKQYELREDHFTELIQERGGLKLMNDKKPEAFRKSLFTKEMVRHWQ